MKVIITMWLICGLIWMFTNIKAIDKAVAEELPTMLSKKLYYLIPYAKGFAILIGMVMSPITYIKILLKKKF